MLFSDTLLFLRSSLASPHTDLLWPSHQGNLLPHGPCPGASLLACGGQAGLRASPSLFPFKEE